MKLYETIVQTMLKTKRVPDGELPEWMPGEKIAYIDNHAQRAEGLVLITTPTATTIQAENGSFYELSNSRFIYQREASMEDKMTAKRRAMIRRIK